MPLLLEPRKEVSWLLKLASFHFKIKEIAWQHREARTSTKEFKNDGGWGDAPSPAHTRFALELKTVAPGTSNSEQLCSLSHLQMDGTQIGQRVLSQRLPVAFRYNSNTWRHCQYRKLTRMDFGTEINVRHEVLKSKRPNFLFTWSLTTWVCTTIKLAAPGSQTSVHLGLSSRHSRMGCA